MLSEKKARLAGLMTSLITLTATPAFAGSISLEDTGLAFWISVIIGVIIILLQLIPAIILLVSFVARMTGLSQRKRLHEK